jgi:hypothetical protein
MSIKRREPPTYEELARAFVQCHKGRLLYVAGQWMEMAGGGWLPIPNRKMNRLIRNTGWPAECAATVRRQMEHPSLMFAHSGPLPAVETGRPTLEAAAATPIVGAFIERHAGRLLYNQRSKCWMSFDGSGWQYILDREIDTLLCEISGDLSLPHLNNVRRELSQHIGFSV